MDKLKAQMLMKEFEQVISKSAGLYGYKFDRHKDHAKGIFFDCGKTNEAFKIYLLGYQSGVRG